MDWGCMHLTKVRHVKSLTAGSGTLLQSRHHLQETAVISGGVYMNLHRCSTLGSILGAHLARSLLAKPWRSPPDRMSWASGFTQGLGWKSSTQNNCCFQMEQNRVANSLNMLRSPKKYGGAPKPQTLVHALVQPAMPGILPTLSLQNSESYQGMVFLFRPQRGIPCHRQHTGCWFEVPIQ